MNFYSIKSKAEKIDGGFHKPSAYFHQLHFYKKWVNLDHLMLWNIMAMISYKILNSCAVKQPSQYSNGFQNFPGAEAYGKITTHDSSGSRDPCSHSCRAKLQVTVDRSNMCNFCSFVLTLLF